MSTRCMIGKLHDDGSVSAVYCHHDGYPKYVGKLLYDHYNNEDKLNELFERGDMSSLSENVEDCDFYDDGNAPTVYQDLNEFMTMGDDHDYHYYFNSNEKDKKFCWYIIPMRWDEKNLRMTALNNMFLYKVLREEQCLN